MSFVTKGIPAYRQAGTTLIPICSAQILNYFYVQ